MTRCCILVLALVGLLAPGTRMPAATVGQIISESSAMRHGLTRAWWSQIELDRTRARVAHIELHDGGLFVQTDQAVLHALDAETGQTLWVGQVGLRGHPSMAPAANDHFVAVINGSHLYILNRANGKLLWQRQIDGAPGAGPALSDDRVFVPMTSGRVVAYRLESQSDTLAELTRLTGLNTTSEETEAKKTELRGGIRLEQDYTTPLVCQSTGRAMVQPIVIRQMRGEEYVAWPTDRGYLCVGKIEQEWNERFNVQYRLETDAGIAARPTYRPPRNVSDSGVIYAASRDGFVYAIQEKTGDLLWRFATSEPIIEPAVVVDDRVFVVPQVGGMHCLDAVTGDVIWWAPDVFQFIAASVDRIYAANGVDRMIVLNAQTGARLDAVPLVGLPTRLRNTTTDRIYLATETGLVQCLHEIELTEPIRHEVVPKEQPELPQEPAEVSSEQEVPTEPPASERPPESAPGAVEDPFGGSQNPFGDSEDPFGGGEDPFGGAAPSNGGDDPFGAGGDPFGGG